MHNLKKCAIIMVSIILALSLFACGQKQQTDEPYAVSLSDEQIAQVQEFLSDMANNGFLLSYYTQSSQINLD